MTPAPLLAAGALVAVLCLARRCRAAGALLAVSVASDAARLVLAPLRADAPRPYTGGALLLWIACEVVPASLPPAVALAAAGHRAGGAGAAALWIVAVAVAYPALRGQHLLTAWLAYYVALYLAAAVAVVAKAARRREMIRDEFAVLCLVLTGIASSVLVAAVGPEQWWAVAITYGAGLVAAASIAWRPDSPLR